MSRTIEGDRQHVIRITEERGEFVKDVDGYIYYWPSKDASSQGCMSAHHLRWIADELDRRNKDWDEQIEREFAKACEPPSIEALKLAALCRANGINEVFASTHLNMGFILSGGPNDKKGILYRDDESSQAEREELAAEVNQLLCGEGTTDFFAAWALKLEDAKAELDAEWARLLERKQQLENAQVTEELGVTAANPDGIVRVGIETDRKHDLYDREDGLAHCRVCHGAEATLPTDCPGNPMSESTQDNVGCGLIDFVQGQWVQKKAESKTDEHI